MLGLSPSQKKVESFVFLTFFFGCEVGQKDKKRKPDIFVGAGSSLTYDGYDMRKSQRAPFVVSGNDQNCCIRCSCFGTLFVAFCMARMTVMHTRDTSALLVHPSLAAISPSQLNPIKKCVGPKTARVAYQ